AQRDAVGDRLARFALADRPRDELLEAFDRRRRRRNELRHFGRAERGEEVLRVAGAQFAKLDDLAGERRQTAAPVDARGRRRNRGGEHRHLVNGEAHDYLPPFTEVPQMMLSSVFAVPQMMLSRSAVPQMMLSPPSVPQMMLSSEVPQMMLSPAAVPQMMLSVSSAANVICSEFFFAISLFSAADVPQMMLSSADDVPQMMLSSPVVPQMMLSSSFAQVPQMMLSPSSVPQMMLSSS